MRYGAIDGGREDGKAGADAPELSGEPVGRSAARRGLKRQDSQQLGQTVGWAGAEVSGSALRIA